MCDLVSYNVNQRDYKDTYVNIHFTSSVDFEYGQLETTGKEITKPSIEQHLVQVSSRYDDAFFKIGDVPMLVFPQSPDRESDHHIQISDGNHDLGIVLAHSLTLSYHMSVSSISRPTKPKGRVGLDLAPWSGMPSRSMVGGPPSHSAI
jgi:hypothetical protein